MEYKDYSKDILKWEEYGYDSRQDYILSETIELLNSIPENEEATKEYAAQMKKNEEWARKTIEEAQKKIRVIYVHTMEDFKIAVAAHQKNEVIIYCDNDVED